MIPFRLSLMSEVSQKEACILEENIYEESVVWHYCRNFKKWNLSTFLCALTTIFNQITTVLSECRAPQTDLWQTDHAGDAQMSSCGRGSYSQNKCPCGKELSHNLCQEEANMCQPNVEQVQYCERKAGSPCGINSLTSARDVPLCAKLS